MIGTAPAKIIHGDGPLPSLDPQPARRGTCPAQEWRQGTGDQFVCTRPAGHADAHRWKRYR